MRLQKDNVVLEPTKDLNYILDISLKYKYNKLNREQARKVLENFGYKFWQAYVDGEKSGAVYISYIPKLGYTIDAYKDQRVRNEFKYSRIAGELVIEYFFKNIFSRLHMAFDSKNKALKLLARRLKFVEIDKIVHKWGEFIVMRRDKWQN